MVNLDILSGLKNAMERGQSLKSAMMSFYNASYPREEIEEAARVLVELPEEEFPKVQNIPKTETPAKMPVQELKIQASAKEEREPEEPVFKMPSAKPLPKAYPQALMPMQKISSYSEGKESRKSQGGSNKAVIAVLILLLVILVGILASIFFFKQELIDWLNTMFAG